MTLHSPLALLLLIPFNIALLPVLFLVDHAYKYYLVYSLPPFLMTLPSDTDLWMFVSSRGGLTAGRADAASARMLRGESGANAAGSENRRS